MMSGSQTAVHIIIYWNPSIQSAVHSRVGVKFSTCTWYLYLSTYLTVLDVLEYLVYGNVKVLVLVLDQKVLGKVKVIFKYYSVKSVKIANYLNTLL